MRSDSNMFVLLWTSVWPVFSDSLVQINPTLWGSVRGITPHGLSLVDSEPGSRCLLWRRLGKVMKLSSFGKRYNVRLLYTYCTYTCIYDGNRFKSINFIVYIGFSSLLWWNSTTKGPNQNNPISSSLPSSNGGILSCKKSDWWVPRDILSSSELICTCQYVTQLCLYPNR